MKLKHPASKVTVEADDPQQYLTQGWVEVRATAKKSEPKPKGEDK